METFKLPINLLLAYWCSDQLHYWRYNLLIPPGYRRSATISHPNSVKQSICWWCTAKEPKFIFTHREPLGGSRARIVRCKAVIVPIKELGCARAQFINVASSRGGFDSWPFFGGGDRDEWKTAARPLALSEWWRMELQGRRPHIHQLRHQDHCKWKMKAASKFLLLIVAIFHWISFLNVFTFNVVASRSKGNVHYNIGLFI